MDERLKQRLIGAVVLVVAAVIFVPMMLDEGGEPREPSHRLIEPRPPADASTRVLPLDEDTAAPAALPAESPAPPPAKSAAEAPAGASPRARDETAAKGFAVQLGSFSKAENARGLRDKLVRRGYPAFVRTTGTITRVYVGPQKDRAEAEKMLEKLLAETKLKGIVVNLSG